MTKGLIGYFGLDNWWLNSFSALERKYIIDTYKPMALGEISLVEGNIDFITISAINFLSTLSGWFTKDEDIDIILKIFEKADEIAHSNTSFIDLHFYYSHKIEYFYKKREIYPNGIDIAIESCKKQIEISEKVSAELRKEYKNSPLPRHLGFEQLAIIEEKRKNFENVILLCQKAALQEWDGDWQKRIERCQKKYSSANKI